RNSVLVTIRGKRAEPPQVAIETGQRVYFAVLSSSPGVTVTDVRVLAAAAGSVHGTAASEREAPTPRARSGARARRRRPPPQSRRPRRPAPPAPRTYAPPPPAHRRAGRCRRPR